MDFSRIFIVFAIDFSVIWLHPLSYLGVWTDSLSNYPLQRITSTNLNSYLDVVYSFKLPNKIKYI